MPNPKVKEIIQTAIIGGFTIAAALIWKDVIISIVALLLPPQNELFYQFIAALFATLFIIIAIYILYKTESEAERVVKRFQRKNKKT